MAGQNSNNDAKKESVEVISEEQIVDESKKLDVLDFNFPLFRRLREEAPGTHKHSQTLMSMTENVCAALGIEGTTLKMATMYHDIGKLWSPFVFSENQNADENIHDELEPWVSCHLITRHVSDSIAILVANNFPLEVIHIVSQHHGTSILKAIYEKAVKAKGRKRITIPASDFRYKTEKPLSLESLILMLCDNIEARSRAVYVEQKRDVDPAVFVLDTFNSIMADGQFDEVQIRLGHINIIQEALIADISANFHKRVEYEGDKKL